MNQIEIMESRVSDHPEIMEEINKRISATLNELTEASGYKYLSRALKKKALSKILKVKRFQEVIKKYLESNPRLSFIEKEHQRMIDKIESIDTLADSLRTNIDTEVTIKARLTRVRKEQGYSKFKKQKDNLSYILNLIKEAKNA